MAEREAECFKELKSRNSYRLKEQKKGEDFDNRRVPLAESMERAEKAERLKSNRLNGLKS